MRRAAEAGAIGTAASATAAPLPAAVPAWGYAPEADVAAAAASVDWPPQLDFPPLGAPLPDTSFCRGAETPVGPFMSGPEARLLTLFCAVVLHRHPAVLTPAAGNVIAALGAVLYQGKLVATGCCVAKLHMEQPFQQSSNDPGDSPGRSNYQRQLCADGGTGGCGSHHRSGVRIGGAAGGAAAAG